MLHKLLATIFLLSLCFSMTTLAESGAPKPELLSVEKIWDTGEHNAFTDLIRFDGKWFCTFREGDGHVGGDGAIRIITSADGERWESAALITEEGIDLRDPKLSITPDGRLMMLAGGSVYQGGKKLLGRQPRASFSEDGENWTPTARIMEEGDWLWRVTWHEGTAYGVSYASPPGGGEELRLAKTNDGLDYELVTLLDVPDRPNECTLRFLEDGTMVALLRREAGNRNAMIGHAKPPYTDWTWADCGHRVGGPNFIQTPDGNFWASGRNYHNSAQTALARMTLESYEPVLLLPSGGDTSYPGMVYHDGLLWLSYYSSHEGKTNIYLAKIRLGK